MCSILYYFFKYRWSELDIPVEDDVYYEFTKSFERLKNFEVLLQRYCHKNCRTMFTTHFLRKEKKYGKESFDKQLESNLNISENKHQGGKIRNSQ